MKRYLIPTIAVLMILAVTLVAFGQQERRGGGRGAEGRQNISEEERAKMTLLINSELGGIPFIGTFTFGEQGFIPGVGNMHGNLVNSMIIFSE